VDEDEMKEMALFLCYNCVIRNNPIESLGAGIPHSELGITDEQWQQAAKITPEELGEIARQVANNIYTFVRHSMLTSCATFEGPATWEPPKENQSLLELVDDSSETRNFLAALDLDEEGDEFDDDDGEAPVTRIREPSP
jgi:hypothetical protein